MSTGMRFFERTLPSIDGLAAANGDTPVDLTGVPRRLGKQPVSVLALILRVTGQITVPNVGAAILGRNLYNLLARIYLRFGQATLVSGLTGRDGRMLELLENGFLWHTDPADLAINAARLFTFTSRWDFRDYLKGPGAVDDEALTGGILVADSELTIRTNGIAAVSNKAGTTLDVLRITPILKCAAGANERVPLLRIRQVFAQGADDTFTLPPGLYRMAAMFPDDGAVGDTGVADADLSTVTDVSTSWDDEPDLVRVPAIRAAGTAGSMPLAEQENHNRPFPAVVANAATQFGAEVSETVPDRLVLTNTAHCRTTTGGFRRANEKVDIEILGGARPRRILTDRYVPRTPALWDSFMQALQYTGKRIWPEIRASRKAVDPVSANAQYLPLNLFGEDSYFDHLRRKGATRKEKNPALAKALAARGL